MKSLTFRHFGSMIAGVLLIALSCGSTPSGQTNFSKDSYTLTGTLRIATPDNMLAPEPARRFLISLYEMSEKGIKLIDSFRTDNSGKFNYVGRTEGDLAAWLSLGEEYQFPLFIKNGEKVECNISIGNPLLFEAKGNKMMERATEAMRYHFEQNKRVQDLNDSLMALKVDRNDKARIDTLTKIFEARMRTFEEERNKGVMKVLNSNKDNLVGAFIVTKMLKEPTLAQQEEVYEGIKKKYPNSLVTKELGEKISREKPTAVGSISPEIELADPEGKMVKLSSLRGKYVLIDFWASWCKPCRAENPNNVKVYNRFKDKGFEIYGVSLDSDKKAWQDAIKKDGLTWYHVSDLKGWGSSAGATFLVHSIPYTVLIDPSGRIIAKNLRGQALADKLAELFPGN